MSRDMATTTAVPGAAPRPPWIVWAGLAVVLAAAAVLSFDGLRGLGLTVGIPENLAWLLPIAVDAGAAVSCATWLGGRTTRDAARYAGRMTWSLLAVTVFGNAGHLGMVAEHISPPWWVAVGVGAIPPAVVGSTVHLVVLLVRASTPVPVPDVQVPPADVQPDLDTLDIETPSLEERAAEIVANGGGRGTIIRELGVNEYQAKKLLDTSRTDLEVVR